MAFHGRRADFLMRCIASLGLGADATVLDIGRSPLTNLVLSRFPLLTTLGLPLDDTLLDKADHLDSTRVPHIVFDLNAAHVPTEWVVPAQFDLILFNEVVEHLRIAPTWVFRYLHALMRPRAFLVVQTPNAVSLGHRVRMLVGKNPYVEFALDAETGSHHFREYTKRELLGHAERAGLTLFDHRFVNYFPARSAVLRAVSTLTTAVPSFRNGQTFVFQRPG